MKKESAQVVQEIYQIYGLDNYVKDDYTQALFKEFRKYGTKLIKIANFEKMQKQGSTLLQDMKDLMSKKDEFQSYLSSLKHALDLYAASLGQKAAPKQEQPAAPVEPKIDLEAELKKQQLQDVESNAGLISQLLVIGKLLDYADKLAPPLLGPSKEYSEQDLQAVKGLFTALARVKGGAEVKIVEELEKTKASVMSFLLKKEVGIVQTLEKIVANKEVFEGKMKLGLVAEPVLVGKQEQPLPPPGLFPEPAEVQEKKEKGKVSAPVVSIEDAETPPDPSKAMPVSVLVPGIIPAEENVSVPAEQKEELKKLGGEVSTEYSKQGLGKEEGFVYESADQSQKFAGRGGRRVRGSRYSDRGGYARRPRRSDIREYTYVRKQGY